MFKQCYLANLTCTSQSLGPWLTRVQTTPSACRYPLSQDAASFQWCCLFHSTQAINRLNRGWMFELDTEKQVCNTLSQCQWVLNNTLCVCLVMEIINWNGIQKLFLWIGAYGGFDQMKKIMNRKQNEIQGLSLITTTRWLERIWPNEEIMDWNEWSSGIVYTRLVSCVMNSDTRFGWDE
jgi:hypothetical protein